MDAPASLFPYLLLPSGCLFVCYMRSCFLCFSAALALVAAGLFPHFAQAQDASRGSRGEPKRGRVAALKGPTATGYKVRMLHNLLTPEGFRCAISCPKSCEPTVVCTHDTLNRGPRGGYGTERLVYRTSSARVSTWRLTRYEVALTRQLRRLLHQDYVSDSLTFPRIQTPWHSASVAWSQSSLLSAVLLVTPRRDSLLCLKTELMRGRIEEEGDPNPVLDDSRSGEFSEARDSSYCFLLKAGRLTLVSSRNFYLQTQPRYVIEHRLLDARQKGLLPQLKARPPRQKSHFHIDSFLLTEKGLFVSYSFVDSDGVTVPSAGPTEITIPYKLLPAEVFSFSSMQP
jgi:hypothetical protein